MTDHYSETYLSVRQLGGHSKKKAKLTQKEKEIQHERYLNGLIGQWMNQTRAVVTDEQVMNQGEKE